MALGMELGLGLGDFVFGRDPDNPGAEGTPTTTHFWPMFIVTKRLDG